MARKRSIETINKELDKLESREKSLQTDIDSVKSEKEKLLGQRNEILEKERREQVDKLAEIVYEYFGDSIVPDKFRGILEYIFAINEVKNFVNSESIKKEAC